MWVERSGRELDRIIVGLQILIYVSLASIPRYGENQIYFGKCKILAGANGSFK
jgi:hypothetical protein